MLLDELVAAIDNVKSRIELHQSSLRQSEALTRYSLIDPMLRALGWDTADPALVVPEYRAAGGFADYALMGRARPVSLLEAKKLGENLTSGVGQALNYCNEQGINFMLVSDGDTWVMYEVFRQAPIEERRMVSLSVRADPVHEAALKLLLLWRPNLAAGEPVAANEPVLSALIAPPTPVAPAIDVQPPATYPLAPPSNEGWISLNGFQPGRNRPPPSTVRFPDGDERPTQYWVNVLMEVAEWLVRTGKLTSAKYPVAFPLRRGRTRHMINDQPLHSDGTAFVNPRTLSNDLMIELNVSANGAVRNSQFLLQNFGEDAAAVWLKFN